MNRVIKFRAYHKPSGQMYWFDIMNGNRSNTGSGYIDMTPIGEDITKDKFKDNMIPIDPSDCEIMQFTGLHDKNGVECYEGDKDHLDWIVCFNKGAFVLKESLTARTFIPLHEQTDITITGNIHQTTTP